MDKYMKQLQVFLQLITWLQTRNCLKHSAIAKIPQSQAMKETHRSQSIHVSLEQNLKTKSSNWAEYAEWSLLLNEFWRDPISISIVRIYSLLSPG